MDSLEELDPDIAATLKSLHETKLSEEDAEARSIAEANTTFQRIRNWQETKRKELEDFQQTLSTESDLQTSRLAEGVALAGLYDGDDDFLLKEDQETAKACLLRLTERLAANHSLKRACIKTVLDQHIKPLFARNPHPRVNPSTGRKVHIHEGSRPLYHDLYDEQVWKNEGRGCWNTFRWCITHAEPSDYDVLWPSLIPPLMTMLDDYGSVFRIKGIQVLQDFLKRVDSGLLRRTGIDTLFAASLDGSMTYLTDPHITTMLPLCTATSQVLVEKTTQPESQTRFERLSDIISKGIIGGAWAFIGHEEDAMEASVRALRPLVEALGIGTCRFLKAIIPQLTVNLAPKPFRPPRPALQISSAECLLVVMSHCEARVAAWQGTIMDGILRAWVLTADAINDRVPHRDTEAFRGSLRQLTRLVVEKVPDATMALHEALDLDYSMFESLVHQNVIDLYKQRNRVDANI